MKDFISSPIYDILCRIFDLVILNLVYILCCLPVITIGAATAALYRGVQAVQKDTGALLRIFWNTFKSSLKQGILGWLLWLAAATIVCVDFCIVSWFWNFGGKYLLLGLLALAGVLFLLAGGCLFPLLSWSASLKEALLWSFVLSLRYLPRVFFVCLINLLPIFLFILWPYAFLLTSGCFLLIGLSLSAYVNSLLLRPVLSQVAKERNT